MVFPCDVCRNLGHLELTYSHIIDKIKGEGGFKDLRYVFFPYFFSGTKEFMCLFVDITKLKMVQIIIHKKEKYNFHPVFLNIK